MNNQQLVVMQQEMAQEIVKQFDESLSNSEQVNLAVKHRDYLLDKAERLQGGIEALGHDLQKTEAAIESDRLSLASGDEIDVAKVNKRIAGNMALCETTRTSITAMQESLTSLQRDMMGAKESVGAAVSVTVNGWHDHYQQVVDDLVQEAVAVCKAYNECVNLCVLERGGRVTPSTRPMRLSLADEIDVFQLIRNRQMVTRPFPTAPMPRGSVIGR